jgi:dipeptidyl aminopeptidase/acylaminoacyl peptidase
MIVDLLDNRELLDQISSNTYVADISGPVQLHHAKGDETVPYMLSQRLADDLMAAGKEHELYLYEDDDHNLSGNFGTAMARSVAFFDEYVKGGGQ